MQGCGIATHLLGVLERIAKENEFTGFSATVLKENTAMIHVFRKRYPDAQITLSGGGEMAVAMDFDSLQLEDPAVAEEVESGAKATEGG
jgi:ribosomal protein S18 acetylase RimI-like enzyme